MPWGLSPANEAARKSFATRKKRRQWRLCSTACPSSSRAKLADAGFELDGELVVKRILNRSGKNRIYLNGSLCSLNVLADIGGSLVHIYGQHEHHSLLQPETHLNLLDAFADVDAMTLAMKQQFVALTAAWSDLNETRDSLDRRRRERANLASQVEEIARAQLKAGEEEELRARKNILAHSEKLTLGCREGEELALRRRRRIGRPARQVCGKAA